MGRGCTGGRLHGARTTHGSDSPWQHTRLSPPPSPLSPGPYFAGVADKTVTVLLKLAERQENRVALVEAGVPAGVEAFLAAHGAAAGPGSLPVGVIQKAKDVLVELLEPLDAGTA